MGQKVSFFSKLSSDSLFLSLKFCLTFIVSEKCRN